MNFRDNNGYIYQTTIRQWCMARLVINNESYVKSITQIGINNQCHFVCKTEYESQVWRLLDEYFDSLSEFFDISKTLSAITRYDEPPWRSGCIQLSHRIEDYVKSLNLPYDGKHMFVFVNNKPNHQAPTEQCCTLGGDMGTTHTQIRASGISILLSSDMESIS